MLETVIEFLPEGLKQFQEFRARPLEESRFSNGKTN